MKKKESASEFEAKDLPSTRKEQFFDISKHRFFLLFALGALFLLFSLPFLASLLYHDIFALSVSSSDLSADDKETALFGAELLFSAAFVASLLIMGLGLGGIGKVLRRLLYDEPIFFKEDFFSGIKENAKQYLLLSLFVGLVWLLSHWVSYLSNNYILKGAFYGINVALIYPPLFVAFFLSGVYSNPLSKNIVGGFSLYFKAFPSVFLCFLSFYAMSFLQYVPILILKYALLVLLFLLYTPFSLLLSFCNCMRLFDEEINKDQFPESYKKGLADYYRDDAE